MEVVSLLDYAEFFIVLLASSQGWDLLFEYRKFFDIVLYKRNLPSYIL